MTAEIAYVCVAPTHQSERDGTDKLTIHEGAWAYCPYDSVAGGHEWRPSRDPSVPHDRRTHLVSRPV